MYKPMIITREQFLGFEKFRKSDVYNTLSQEEVVEVLKISIERERLNYIIENYEHLKKIFN